MLEQQYAEYKPWSRNWNAQARALQKKQQAEILKKKKQQSGTVPSWWPKPYSEQHKHEWAEHKKKRDDEQSRHRALRTELRARQKAELQALDEQERQQQQQQSRVSALPTSAAPQSEAHRQARWTRAAAEWLSDEELGFDLEFSAPSLSSSSSSSSSSSLLASRAPSLSSEEAGQPSGAWEEWWTDF